MSAFRIPGACAANRERLTVETSGHVGQHRAAHGHRPSYRIDRVRLTTSLLDHGIAAGGCGSCYVILTAWLETTTTTRPHAAAGTHATAAWAHAATSGRRFGGQCHTTRLGALLHLLLLRHELAAIDLFLFLFLFLNLGDFYGSSYRASRSDQDVPLGEKWVSFQPGLDSLHGILGHGDSFFIDRAAQFDDGMNAFPRHALCPLQHRLGVGELGAVPVLFQDSPATLHRIVFAVVRRIVQEADGLPV